MNTYLRQTLIVGLIGLLAAFGIGMHLSGGDTSVGIMYAYQSFLLSIIEVSLSFDNVIINAKYLRKMNPVGRAFFLWVGLPIAAFGMRGFFPIAIVSIAAHISPAAALHLALTDTAEYARIVQSANPEIMAFGSVFLSLVAGEFFFDGEKDVHWIKPLEVVFAFLGKFKHFKYVMALILVGLIKLSIPAGIHAQPIIIAGLVGILTYFAVQKIGDLLESEDEDVQETGAGKSKWALLKASAGSLIYLEVLDASFSFDGVIGALAITSYIPLIFIGLTVGAMAVRSLTMYSVTHTDPSKIRFLEHGAMWSIASLVASMIWGIGHAEVSEFFTGTLSAGLIVLAVLSSKWWKRKYGGTAQQYVDYSA